MARMIPSFGPQATESPGEILLYNILQAQLSDEFTVVHSLPWLCSAAKNIDTTFAPTGEIDFLVINQELGVLALEVKSGRYRIDGVSFVHLKSGKATAPIQQTRHNVHGLARWLGSDNKLRLRIGYGLVFPDSEFGDEIISSALVDLSVSPQESIAIDKSQVSGLGKRIVEIMQYWKQSLRTLEMSDEVVQKLIETLCPQYDGTPKWATRVLFDNQIWLPLTAEQGKVVAAACDRPRMVVTGWPGTGKTLIGITLAREMVSRGKRVLFLTFNSLLAEHLARQLDFKAVDGAVSTWHGLCVQARKRLGKTANINKDAWYQDECVDDLKAALDRGLIDSYDVLILDEAQALHPNWCNVLFDWFRDGQVMAFCDETQVFPFELGVIGLRGLCDLLGVEDPFLLTIALRTPKAVTDRLLSVKPVSYQLQCPRPDETDTVQEFIVDDTWSALLELITKFKADRIDGGDILVLSKYELREDLVEILRGLGVRSEIVSRFRGLEAPVAVVLDADSMDDAELFCAYSRATTVCVALYEAESMGWHTKGSFQKQVMAIGANRVRAENARIDSLAGNILRGNLDVEPIPITSIELAWSPTWGAWLTEFDDLRGSGVLWLDFLACHYEWPTYYWDKNSRRIFHHAAPVDDLSSDSTGMGALRLHCCDQCGGPSPHQRGFEVECVFCAGRERKRGSRPTQEIVERIKVFDEILQLKHAKTSAAIQVGDLPISLAAFGARRYAEEYTSKDFSDMTLPSGRIVYRAALAFVQSRIAYLPAGREIVVSDLAVELHERYHEIREGMALEGWRSTVANAVATCFQKALLAKARKGVYLTI